MFMGKPILEGTWRGEKTEYVAGEIVLMFQSQDAPADKVAQSIGGKVIRGVEHDGFAIIEVNQNANVLALCEKLYDTYSSIRWVEPNMIQTIQEWVPNDPYFLDSTQWSLKNVHGNSAYGVPDADIDAPWAWSYTTGDANVILAILDSGIDMDTATMTLCHSDLNLAGKIILGPDYIGDGYGVADLHGHGTHVAGIASAETNNGVGIAGVAEDCKILVIQVFDAFGDATETSIRDGINYAVSYQQSHPSQRVIMNFSGRGTAYSTLIFNALEDAEAEDIPFVTVSGNDVSSTCGYPCQHSSDFDNLICVGATTPRDNMSDYSNHCNDVDVVAPGGAGDYWHEEYDVWSCVPPNSYAYKCGTSMSAPHVTGICGLVVSLNMTISAELLRNLIQFTADDETGWTEDVLGYDNYYGNGRANAWSAVIHSPIFTTPYLRNDERCSNTYTYYQSHDYRLDAPPTGLWEIVATRPHSAANINVRWIDTDQTTILTTSSYTGDNVDFVLAHGRPTSGADYYARVYNASGFGKFAVEYQQASQSYIGSFSEYTFHWKSGHLVEIYEVYLQHDHRYVLDADQYSSQMDIGIALIGPAPAGEYFTNRSSALMQRDANGEGGSERDTVTITTGSGWYAFVVYSNNGRNASCNIGIRELLETNYPVTRTEVDNVDVGDGHFYHRFPIGATTAVLGLRPYSGNNYDLELYEFDYYGGYGTYLARSGQSFSTVDFILYDKDTSYARTYYPFVDLVTTGGDSTGFGIHVEDNDEVLSLGTNGSYLFSGSTIVHAWDLEMTEGVEYEITGDIVSGTPDIGIALFRIDDEFKNRSQYVVQDYSSGPGYDEEFTWLCDSTGTYALVAWSQNWNTGTYYIEFIVTPPNLTTTVPTGWDFEFVPRNTSGAAYDNCHITTTLPGNTTNTWLNFCALNDATNPVPSDTFYNQLYLDGAYFFQRPRTTGLPSGTTFYHLNWLNTTPIRGGKHTVELRLDGTNTIAESDENDNRVSRQFVWSPYLLSNGVTVTRSAPPVESYQFTQPNCDGFQYTRTGAYAYGIGICPAANTDYDLRVYSDYVGSLQGYDTLKVGSYQSSGLTDFAVATYSGVVSTVYPGVYDHSGQGSANFAIQAIDAAGKLLNPSLDVILRDTLQTSEILNVYESLMLAGKNYTVTVQNVSGTADLALALYGPVSGYYARSNYVAYSNVSGPNETLTYTVITTGYYISVVFKPSYTGLSLANIYDVSVYLTPSNLTYSTPTGWSYPVVPRNAAGADSNNCTLTASLPGNTANTYLNFCSYNQGPNATTTSYLNYIFVDSVSWYGTAGISPHPVATYSKHLNKLSSNVIRGGRHTMAIFIDRNNTIIESNESDNWYARQFIWSPYPLSDGTSVNRNAPPMLGSETYPNCDGFEYTTGWWGAVGILPYNTTNNYDLWLFNPWTNSLTGFDVPLLASEEASGLSDFIIATDQVGGGDTYDVGVVQGSATLGTGNFVIQQANEEDTWYNYGTYGPFTFGSNQVLGVWEVYLDSVGYYSFRVEVDSGTADLGTSLYDGSNPIYSKSDYFTGGFSNATGSGGDESFTIMNPYDEQYFGWVVWKVSSNDRLSSATFHLTWGIGAPPVPRSVENLVIERVDSTGARLLWSPVTEDTSGQPLTTDYYRIHRNTDPDFTPSPADSIGYTPGGTTTFLDANAIWNNQKYFYQVIAVDTDGVMVSGATGNSSFRIVTGQPSRTDSPEAIRSRRH
jgi:thermitase